MSDEKPVPLSYETPPKDKKRWPDWFITLVSVPVGLLAVYAFVMALALQNDLVRFCYTLEWTGDTKAAVVFSLLAILLSYLWFRLIRS